MNVIQESRRERKRKAARAALVAAAGELFLDLGLESATMAEIARRADLAVGTIYLHFKGKTELYLAVVEHALDIDQGLMDEALSPGVPPSVQLIRAADAHIRLYLEHPGYFRLLELPYLSMHPAAEVAEAAQQISERLEGEVRRVAKVVEAGIAAGEVKPVDPYRCARFLWGAWNGVIALNLRPDRLRLAPEELLAVLDTGRRMIAEGLATEALRRADGSLRPELLEEMGVKPEPPQHG